MDRDAEIYLHTEISKVLSIAPPRRVVGLTTMQSLLVKDIDIYEIGAFFNDHVLMAKEEYAEDPAEYFNSSLQTTTAASTNTAYGHGDGLASANAQLHQTAAVAANHATGTYVHADQYTYAQEPTYSSNHPQTTTFATTQYGYGGTPATAYGQPHQAAATSNAPGGYVPAEQYNPYEQQPSSGNSPQPSAAGHYNPYNNGAASQQQTNANNPGKYKPYV